MIPSIGGHTLWRNQWHLRPGFSESRVVSGVAFSTAAFPTAANPTARTPSSPLTAVLGDTPEVGGAVVLPADRCRGLLQQPWPEGAAAPTISFGP